jgi:hypothetical protein
LSEVVELDVGDLSGLAVVLVVGAAFLVENEFHPVSDLEG